VWREASRRIGRNDGREARSRDARAIGGSDSDFLHPCDDLDSGAAAALLQACLGLSFDPAANTVRFERPVLPQWLQEVTLRGIDRRGERIDVSLRRRGGEVLAGAPARTGDVRVVSVS
jgi:hypothetical protein